MQESQYSNQKHTRRPIGHSCFGVVVLIVTTLIPSGQEIKLRLVNAKSGGPLTKVSVVLSSWNGTFDIHRPPYPKMAHYEAVTDAGGIAVFHLPQPLPEHLGFMLQTPMAFYGCGGGVFSAETVLQTGVIADYDESKCGRLKRPVTAKPGEVVIVERRLTWWQQMCRELPFC